MGESMKQRKRNVAQPNKSIVNRGNIDANWQTLLLSELMLENKNNTSNQDNKIIYSRTFSRSVKKKEPNQTLCINNNSNNRPQIIGKQKCSDFENNDKEIKVKQTSFPPKRADRSKVITKFVAMDCEMVGIGFNGEDNMLARVSLVNKFGDCIYDKFVKPREKVIDYRTHVSGVRREDLLNGEEFTIVQKEVSEILKGRILVGHSVIYDLKVLFLSHPKKSIRDTSTYKPFKAASKGRGTPSLKRLAKEILDIDIQSGEHSSVEDAQAVMQIYCTVAKSWEMMMSQKAGGSSWPALK